jgi:hypothetical protein
VPHGAPLPILRRDQRRQRDDDRQDRQPPGTCSKALIAKGRVSVSPGIDDTKIAVAPNSPSALAKPSTVPAMMPGRISGRVMVANTRRRVAPSVAAAASSRRSMPSSANRIGLTINGKAMTPAAIAAPVQRNSTDTPTLASACPAHPLRPNASNSRYPVTTGGITSGRLTSASMIGLPGKRRRASRNASPNATGIVHRVATPATFRLTRIAALSARLNSRPFKARRTPAPPGWHGHAGR